MGSVSTMNYACIEFAYVCKHCAIASDFFLRCDFCLFVCVCVCVCGFCLSIYRVLGSWCITFDDSVLLVIHLPSCGAWPAEARSKAIFLSVLHSLLRYCLWVFVCVLSAYPFIEFMELGLHRGEEDDS